MFGVEVAHRVSKFVLFECVVVAMSKPSVLLMKGVYYLFRVVE
jgi:hypothetical protein